MSASYTGLLPAVYLRYSPYYKHRWQVTTTILRQFSVGSVAGVGANPVGDKAASNCANLLFLFCDLKFGHPHVNSRVLAPKFVTVIDPSRASDGEQGLSVEPPVGTSAGMAPQKSQKKKKPDRRSLHTRSTLNLQLGDSVFFVRLWKERLFFCGVCTGDTAPPQTEEGDEYGKWGPLDGRVWAWAWGRGCSYLPFFVRADITGTSAGTRLPLSERSWTQMMMMMMGGCHAGGQKADAGAPHTQCHRDD
ncbi:hypothetical protein F5148DRAFT_1149386 [Russula earlei]|uniref:Uncharacterized protein n=1 Tax=Russula earlei TaxID=71964 RepID=A0ACC0U8R7_9AGAM|nr:hypothetical protein F5148DRAFT_1149386 [Russula earlei]